MKRIIKVASNSSVPSVAGSIVKSLEENKQVEVHTIGASATSQCVKALASARGILASKGYDLMFVPGFGSTEIDGQEKTMMIFRVIVQ